MYLKLSNNDELPQLPELKHYKCVVIIEGEVASHWQKNVSSWLVSTGCLYMMAWGLNCSSWDDSVDLANLEKFDQEIPEHGHVITTWHDKETLEDVFWFAKFVADNEFHTLDILLLHISKISKEIEFTELYNAI